MATTGFVDPEPGALVERFSWEVEARERTEADTVEYDQLRSDFLLERDRRARERQRHIETIEERFGATRSDDAIVFEKAKQQLLESMKKFRALTAGSKGTEVTCWDDVASAAAVALSQWEAKAKDSRVGRVKEWVRKMCNGMNNHATALKMLPSESEYVSLVAGSVSMIIKASANYINISEAFARGMVEINDAVGLENLSHVYDTPVLQQLAMRLYAQIFSYLIKFMTWFTDRSRTRFLKSFNEHSLRLFEEELAQVKRISSLLSRQIQLHVSADVRVSKLLLEDLSGDIQYLLKFSEAEERQSRLRDAANAELLREVLRGQFEKTKDEVRECLLGVMSGYHEMIRSGVSGSGMANLLEQQASVGVRTPRRLSASPSLGVVESHTTTTPKSRRSPEVENELAEPASSSTDIRFESRHLEDYFSWEHVHPFLETPTPLLADAAFVARLNAFTTTANSQILYAHGQYHSQGDDVLRQAALTYMTLAQEAGVPVISYFCDLSHDEPPANRTRESVELCALLCAVIRQLVNLLPVQDADAALTLDGARFSAIDGTLRTWREALALFEDLVSRVRLPLLLFVIYGLNSLEDDAGGTTAEALKDLVHTLAQIATPRPSSGEGGIIKILFMSSGLSETLCRRLDEESQIACDSSSPRGVRGSRRARQVVSY